MGARVSTNNSGFTLIELMIALIIFAVGMLALLSVTGSIMNYSLENAFRNEGIKVIETAITDAKNNKTPQTSATRTVRGFPITYSITTQTVPMGELNQITAIVSWQYKGNTYQHSISTVGD